MVTIVEEKYARNEKDRKTQREGERDRERKNKYRRERKMTRGKQREERARGRWSNSGEMKCRN